MKKKRRGPGLGRVLQSRESRVVTTEGVKRCRRGVSCFSNAVFALSRLSALVCSLTHSLTHWFPKAAFLSLLLLQETNNLRENDSQPKNYILSCYAMYAIHIMCYVVTCTWLAPWSSFGSALVERGKKTNSREKGSKNIGGAWWGAGVRKMDMPADQVFAFFTLAGAKDDKQTDQLFALS